MSTNTRFAICTHFSRNNLFAGDFTGTVALSFEDGSLMYFTSAFCVKIGEYIEVYTEHCGYHKILAASVEFINGDYRT